MINRAYVDTRRGGIPIRHHASSCVAARRAIARKDRDRVNMSRRNDKLGAFSVAGIRMVSLFPSTIIYCGIVLASVMFCLCSLVLYQSREDALEHSRETSRNVALIAERDITRNFEIYALSLQAVVDGQQQAEIRALPRHLQYSLLFDRAVSAKYPGTMLVLDASGNIVVDQLQETVPRQANFADREYFIVQRDNPHAGLYISHPFLSRLHDGEPTIALSRRISNPDGSFAGVVILGLKLQYFRELFAGLSLGKGGAIALTLTDGTLLMRQPYAASSIGANMKHTPNFAKFSAAEHGSFIGTATIDGVRRLYVFDKLDGLPMILNIGVVAGDFYGGWMRRTVVIGSLMLIFGLAFIGLSMMFASQFKQRARAESELRRLARTDGLTGLVNRRTLDEILELEWLRAQRSSQAMSVLFIDIDHFKAYNDTCGHQTGDETLIEVGSRISENIHRPGDLAARYGGEEFVAVLPETSAEHALRLAESIREAVRAMALPHSASQHGWVTVSIGVASGMPGDFADVSALLKAADDALYQAKFYGRNRVAAYRPVLSLSPDAVGSGF